VFVLVNNLRSPEGYLDDFFKEGVVYLFYPLALLAGILFYHLMNHVDQNTEMKTAKVRKSQ
jgi:hypothetical protein